MAKKQTEDESGGFRRWLLIGTVSCGVFVLAFGGIYAFGKVENFLIRDARFAIPAPKDYGDESANIHISGVKHASPDRIRAAFTRDIGRSLYLFPVAERRRNLLAVDWVKEATVQRVWPNEIRVQITERTPVAFVPVGKKESTTQRFALIDEEGQILTLNDKAQFHIPVLLGAGQELPMEQRQERLRRVMRLLTEIGPLVENVSEIDVTDPESLRVTMEAGGRVVTLLLGREHFAARLRNFLNHEEEIRRRLPEKLVLDLRLEDRITAME